jgi:cytochrome c oxidase accessory protein FixG
MAARPPLRTPSLDSVTTINADGSRFFVHPADVRGRFTLARRIAGLLLIVVYAALPWIRINGEPAVFLDVVHRQFHFFGFTLAPQDLWLMFFLITGLGFSLFLVTALLGRIWCGWACPQTVFLDGVFRRIERWIEGDALERRKLDAAPWTPGKALRRAVKHALYLLLSLLIAHLFLSYFVSLPHLYEMATHSPLEHWGPFLFVMALTGALYFNFAWFREQFCIVLCPYGRLQSALIDDHSVVIGYDAKRGEPRGKASDPANGDCIDCRRCIQVCPTAIDIRQGLQLECIGCSNCIDACDEIMAKLDRPKGLVRYDSLNAFSGRPTRFLRPRTIVYAVLLTLGAAVFAFSLTRLRSVTVSVLRMPGSAFYEDADSVRNQFMVRILNKRAQPATFTVRASADAADGIRVAGFEAPVEIAGRSEIQRPLVVSVPRVGWRGQTPLNVTIASVDGRSSETRQIPLLGPDR